MDLARYDSLPTVLTEGGSTGTWLTVQHVLFRTNERSSYPTPSDLVVSLVFLLMWILLRKLAFTTVLLKAARRMGAPDSETEYKWAVLAWNCLFHTWSTLWLLDWLPQHRWYWQTSWLWENINDSMPQKMELEFKCFYMLQLGYHLQSIIWHLLEERRQDFVTMMVHHIVTVLLIVGSYLSFYCRIGLLVLLVHDASDIFVCTTKCFHFCHWKRCSHTSFVLMVIFWFYMRLYLYPFWVIGATWSYPEPNRFGAMWYLFVVLMSILLVLHVWWFHLFIKMAMGIAKHGSGKDLTENKEAEEELARSKKKDVDVSEEAVP